MTSFREKPAACDIVGSLYALQYLIHSTCTFVLVNAAPTECVHCAARAFDQQQRSEN